MSELSDSERAERRANVDAALGSLALERMQPSPEARETYESFARGDLDADQLGQAIEQMAARARRPRP